MFQQTRSNMGWRLDRRPLVVPSERAGRDQGARDQTNETRTDVNTVNSFSPPAPFAFGSKLIPRWARFVSRLRDFPHDFRHHAPFGHKLRAGAMHDSHEFPARRINMANSGKSMRTRRRPIVVMTSRQQVSSSRTHGPARAFQLHHQLVICCLCRDTEHGHRAVQLVSVVSDVPLPATIVPAVRGTQNASLTSRDQRLCSEMIEEVEIESANARRARGTGSANGLAPTAGVMRLTRPGDFCLYNRDSDRPRLGRSRGPSPAPPPRRRAVRASG